MSWILYIIFFWFLCILALWLWKSSLFKKTWQEPYYADTPVLIESDDWGPGGEFHAIRLQKLLTILNQYKDSVDRTAVLTADIVLSVPDIYKIKNSNNAEYFRISLEYFPGIYNAMQSGIQQGTFVPQLHGLEHLNGKSFALMCQKNDPRTLTAQTTENWWDWETLDSPLQGHYVDGSSLPTTSISRAEANSIINTAAEKFQQLFGYSSISTVAPCYLWNDETEQEWQKQDIQIIQTAGYRCTKRDANGKYIQNPSIIRTGEKNKLGQIYLVRNVMFEPVDGKNTPETAFKEALTVYNQALPISISTHRYNYTQNEEELENSLLGLSELLTSILQNFPHIRFLSSPELGSAIESPDQIISNHFDKTTWPSIKNLTGFAKFRAFLYRLYFRHPKLILSSYLTGLILPAWIICKIPYSRIQRHSS